MFRYCLSIISVALFLVAGGEQEAHAQRVPNYNRRATVSPYINLFNSNQGGVNNYLSFVRPMQQQARFNQMQSNENRFLQQQLMHQRTRGQINQFAARRQRSSAKHDAPRRSGIRDSFHGRVLF